MTKGKSSEIVTRSLGMYSATLNMLSVIAAAGLAASGTIIQVYSEISWKAIGSVASFAICLCLCFFAMTYLMTLAEEENPDLSKDGPYRISFGAYLSFVFGIIFLVLLLISQNSDKKKESAASICNSPIYFGEGKKNEKLYCEKADSSY